MKSGLRPRDWGLFIAALLLLNAALTFGNVWPTLALRLTPDLSVEAAALILLLAICQRRLGPPPQRLLLTCAAVLGLLVLSRYCAVMADSLYGRDINLYWDSQHIAGVIGMFARVAPVWLSAAALLGLLLLLAVIFGGSYLTLKMMTNAMATHAGHRTATVLAAAILGLFVVQRVGGIAERPRFATPVLQTYAKQAGLLAAAVTGDALAGGADEAPVPDVDLANLKGTDVLVMFVESYGAVTYDRPDVAAAMAASRSELEAAIRETGRVVVSAFAGSPTFAGGSWLAHLSFMSGVEVRDPGGYATLMTQQRDTFATPFARAGYRTVALMPGIRLAWPEGAFYRFDALLDAQRLDYRGPEFGWWRIPDQFALARFDELEFERQPRQPLFLLFTSISTHMPFLPTPPYQPDWPLLLTETPFADDEVAEALAKEPNWNDMGPDYAQTMSYSLTTLAGYLRRHAGRDLLMMIIGDHQPAANVAGEGASWDVPIHIVADRAELIAPLLQSGFTPGIHPLRPAVADLHALMPAIAKALSGDEPEAATIAQGD